MKQVVAVLKAIWQLLNNTITSLIGTVTAVGTGTTEILKLNLYVPEPVQFLATAFITLVVASIVIDIVRDLL